MTAASACGISATDLATTTMAKSTNTASKTNPAMAPSIVQVLPIRQYSRRSPHHRGRAVDMHHRDLFARLIHVAVGVERAVHTSPSNFTCPQCSSTRSSTSACGPSSAWPAPEAPGWRSTGAAGPAAHRRAVTPRRPGTRRRRPTSGTPVAGFEPAAASAPPLSMSETCPRQRPRPPPTPGRTPARSMPRAYGHDTRAMQRAGADRTAG